MFRWHVSRLSLALTLALALALAMSAALSGCRRNRPIPFAGWAFVAAAGDSAVAVVDLESFSVRRRIPLQSRPAQIIADASRHRLYVRGEGGPAGLTVIDALTLEPTRTLWLGDKLARLRLSPDGRLLYSLDARAHRLRSFDVETSQAHRDIALSGLPADFDLSPDGHWAGVTLGGGQVAIVDLEQGRVTASVAVGQEPGPIAIRYDGRQAFVANRAGRTVSVLEFPAGRLITHLGLGARPASLCFKPDGGELFVSGSDRSMVVIIAAYRNEIDQPVLAGSEPDDMAVTRDNQLLLVANSGANTVSVIGIDDRRTLAAIPVGRDPRRIVLTPDDQWALVLNYGSGDMAVIRRRTAEQPGKVGDRTRSLFSMIPVGNEPVDVAVLAR